MIDNIKLFEFSSKNKEPYIDKYYVKDNEPIITRDPGYSNDLMSANLKVIENITAYKIATEAQNSEMQEVILRNIIDALNVSGINFSEFTSYWAIKDMSHSVYKNTLITEELKFEFLKMIIPEFIKDRHFLYKEHGYSFSTLQVVSDSKAHKKNSDSANRKLRDIFIEVGFCYFESRDLDTFIKSDKVFIFPDRGDKAFFKQLIEYYNIVFDWSKNHEDKKTDLLFKFGNKIFILEHKHMKECGGGQDKQMSEIINFISYKESKNVHYVSFLDGVYFNLLVDGNILSGKQHNQRLGILYYLKNNKQNFFVNTSGFKELLRSLN